MRPAVSPRAALNTLAAHIARASDAVADNRRCSGFSRFMGGAFVGMLLGAAIVLVLAIGAAP